MSAFAPRPLGKTGLMVSPIGIGGGNGISSDDVLYAFERGVNYFFFSSDLHHFSYRRSAEALRTLCARGSSVRDRVVLATVSYVNDPDKLGAALFDQIAELGVDYIDVFHWGWITDSTDCAPLFEASARVKELGVARHVGASFHSRRAARDSITALDVLMLRYNIAHTGIEADVLPQLAGNELVDPGIVVFNTGHAGPRFFHQPPPGYPSTFYVPTTPDCYRFALSNPAVDVVLTGVTNREQIDRALEAVERGPLAPREMEFMREYGSMFKEVPLSPRNAVAALR